MYFRFPISDYRSDTCIIDFLIFFKNVISADFCGQIHVIQNSMYLDRRLCWVKNKCWDLEELIKSVLFHIHVIEIWWTFKEIEAREKIWNFLFVGKFTTVSHKSLYISSVSVKFYVWKTISSECDFNHVMMMWGELTWEEGWNRPKQWF